MGSPENYTVPKSQGLPELILGQAVCEWIREVRARIHANWILRSMGDSIGDGDADASYDVYHKIEGAAMEQKLGELERQLQDAAGTPAHGRLAAQYMRLSQERRLTQEHVAMVLGFVREHQGKYTTPSFFPDRRY